MAASVPPSHRIGSVRPLDRRGARVRIELEDGTGETRAIEVAADVAYRASLRPGMTLDAAALAALERDDADHAAREAALRLLSHRARTRAELVRRLRGKGFEPATVDRCIERLDAVGLIDDAEFARLYIRDRIRLRPRGRRALLAELRGRGVEATVAEAMIDEVVEAEEVSELDLAREAARRWKPRTDDRPRELRRLYSFLARRGFTGETAQIVAREVLGEEG